MFIIDFFIYLFLGYYLQNVLPHTYGIRKPFYFLFTSDYWCGKSSGKKNIKKANHTNNNNDNLQDFDTSFKHLDSLNKKKKF
jgi:hypothetical protein